MSSDINDGSVFQQLEAICQRLTLLRNRLFEAQPPSPLEQQILEELQTAIASLQTAQDTARQQFVSTEANDIERLHASLRQKEILLREIHHRVKNNLQIVSSLLDLQVLRTDDPTVRELLRNNQSRIHLIALVHERLSQAADLSEISLSDYVRGLAMTLVRMNAIEPAQVTLHTEIGAQVNTLPERAIPVGLILNELISNALTHGLRGEKGEIVVKLDQDQTAQLILSVSDSGNRLPANFDPIAADSLGFQLINSLVKQLSGTLQVEQGTQTTFQVRFSALDNS